MLTLRQIEVLRAIMVTGSIAGAARLLNVSAPGISRLMKFTEDGLGVRLFNRRHGRYVPTPESRSIFDLLDNIHRKLEDLQAAIDGLGSGTGRELGVATAPNVAGAVLPHAVKRLKERFADITVAVDSVAASETADYLLLGRGEVVVTCQRQDHSIIDYALLATGRLICLAPLGGEFAGRDKVEPSEIARHPLVGVHPDDPCGRAMTEIFQREDLLFQMSVQTSDGSTASSLVAAGLGLAVMDRFSLPADATPHCRRLDIEADTSFPIYAAYRSDAALSTYAEHFIEFMREEFARQLRGSG